MGEPEQKPDSESGDARPDAAPKPKSSRAVPLVLGINTVAVLAVVALQVLTLLRPAAARSDGRADVRPDHAASAPRRAGEPKPDASGTPGPTLRLADFVVHLRDRDSDRYARMSFEVELPDEKAKEAVTASVPKIRDAFLSYLSDRTAEDLRGSEAIGHVKSVLSQKLAEIAPSAGILGLYITELVVQ